MSALQASFAHVLSCPSTESCSWSSLLFPKKLPYHLKFPSVSSAKTMTSHLVRASQYSYSHAVADILGGSEEEDDKQLSAKLATAALSADGAQTKKHMSSQDIFNSEARVFVQTSEQASILAHVGNLYHSEPQGELELSEDFLSSSKDSSREEVTTRKLHLRSWYGKDGELVSRLPCPDCRGRGYIVCPTCDVGTPDSSCLECNGKGLKTCPHCLGKRTVLMQPVYEETPSKENATRGPLLQIEDDEIIDHMDIHLPPDRKSKRVYSSTPSEVREKIRHALKSLDARTGSVTRRMRRIHNDPILNAKRIAAIKKAKSTEAARKHASEKSRLYFQEPENRLKRSLSVKGVDYYCGHCGEKGHRRNYCPYLPKSPKAIRSYHCSLCGQPGHKRTNCHAVPKSVKESVAGKKLIYRCSICKEVGHNARSCQMKPKQVLGIEGGAQN